MEDKKWNLIAIEDEDGSKRLYRFFENATSGINKNEFTESISIYWQFADDGFPDNEVSEVLKVFEEFMEPLDDSQNNSFVTFVYTGYGKREWCYQAKDYALFMDQLNDALAEKPMFPIEIEHSPDPEWEYYSGIKEMLTEENT
ncbi:DUF695 domain-containing protein [Glaciecola sp. MH2013]|uniref:DUF695 domain-containing protein n=1 Tax=Glaciecola sp. MH2013 TaxID=2785524 RepID=UPI00189FCE16|nr:DUF695 domain-containing protein [Glaciecola sp. MH2013]MBF7074433.1 DUF695 domain-containing protein [Glaciecola sp. MH2013]